MNKEELHKIIEEQKAKINLSIENADGNVLEAFAETLESANNGQGKIVIVGKKLTKENFSTIRKNNKF